MADAEQRTEQVEGAAAEAARRAREEAASVLETGRRKAAEEARAALRDIAASQKERAAEGVGGVARSLHEMARSLTGEQREVTARYVDLAAERLERLAGRLREGDVDELVSATERFARRQPLLFLGSAAAAGFVVARFLRSEEGGGAYREPTSERVEAASSTASPGEAPPVSPGEGPTPEGV